MEKTFHLTAQRSTPLRGIFILNVIISIVTHVAAILVLLAVPLYRSGWLPAYRAYMVELISQEKAPEVHVTALKKTETKSVAGYKTPPIFTQKENPVNSKTQETKKSAEKAPEVEPNSNPQAVEPASELSEPVSELSAVELVGVLNDPVATDPLKESLIDKAEMQIPSNRQDAVLLGASRRSAIASFSMINSVSEGVAYNAVSVSMNAESMSGKDIGNQVIAEINTGSAQVIIKQSEQKEPRKELAQEIAEIKTADKAVKVLMVQKERPKAEEAAASVLSDRQDYVLKTETPEEEKSLTVVQASTPQKSEPSGAETQKGLLAEIPKAIEIVMIASEAEVNLLYRAHPTAGSSSQSKELKPLVESPDNEPHRKSLSIEKADAGIYTLILKRGSAVQLEFRLLKAVGQRLKSYHKVDAPAEFKFIMPEAVFWDDEEYFSGTIESSDSVTKFNSETGLYWTERKQAPVYRNGGN